MTPIRLSAPGTMAFATLFAIPVALAMRRKAGQPLAEVHSAVERIGKGIRRRS